MRSTFGIGEYRTGEGAFLCVGASISTVQRRLVISTPGAGNLAIGGLLSTPIPFAALADAGYPVHVGDYCSSTYRGLTGANPDTAYGGGGGWGWGNSDAITAISAAVTWAATQPGVKTDKVFLIGGSMGATACLNWYKANPTKVAAIALLIPAIDLSTVASNDLDPYNAGANSFVAASMYTLALPQATINLSENISVSGIAAAGLPGPGSNANKVNILTSSGIQVVTFTTASATQLTGCSGGVGTLSASSWVRQGLGASISNAYGNTWPTLLTTAQLSANSPIVWTETAGGLTVPCKVWASDNDPIGLTTSACQTWANAVAAAGGGNTTPTVKSLGAIGHALTSLQSSEILAFFDANGGRA